MDNTTTTPLMAQYNQIKEANKDSLLFFRLGDFYEMFYEDAKICSRELELTLTKRNREKGQDIPMCGVPYHSVDPYIAKLVNRGYRVAICDQVEDPKDAKGIVKRDVTRVITPGTMIDTDYIDSRQNNYLVGLKINDTSKICAIAYLDITTGDFRCTEITGDNLIFRALGELSKLAPREILLDSKTYDSYIDEIQKYFARRHVSIGKIESIRKPENFLKSYFNIHSLDSYGITDKREVISICATMLNHVKDLEKTQDLPIGKIIYENATHVMELNINTQRNLEIIENARDNTTAGTLVGVMDHCVTSQGSRLLKYIIKNPLLDREAILERQSHVDFFINNALIRENTRQALKDIYDIERLLGKIIFGNENGRDLIALASSLQGVLNVRDIIGDKSQILSTDTSMLAELIADISTTIVPEPPFSVREGGFIKTGINPELDELRAISQNGTDYLNEMEQNERARTGIKTLKIKQNNVFGYFIEVPKGQISMVPPEYVRKQTLTTCERYIIDDLKVYEDKIMGARAKINDIEYRIFKELADKIKEHRQNIQEIAARISYIDVMANLAYIALQNSYTKPEIDSGYDIEIFGGRHPIVEKLIPAGTFVKNNANFSEKHNMIILTGPNMSGKSTYMKQIALILIMAQIGSYVPADYAKLPIVDKIFTRIGASDDLLTGQSTFMLEMSEVAHIMNSATSRSFVVLDEIGRGTSTFDGISLATSITEYIHDKIEAKTIFATHYHELTDLEGQLPHAANYRIEVEEQGDKITFTREIVKGGADKSYGIEVARLAGLPRDVLKRSHEILRRLEEHKEAIESTSNIHQMNLFDPSSFGEYIPSNKMADNQENIANLEKEQKEKEQKEKQKMQEHIVLQTIKALNIDTLSPLEALLKLNELKKNLE